ncbi:RBBP9/YdeN family alpha/beta hydrolase [Pedobacter sp. AW1-32]|uniref:RBBP9/YdeN family alpha/beta hydrolase n=1 Tax=Pedobacter sp. AW1-32 TaxID=3383026 RepID=UPI003FEF538F
MTNYFIIPGLGNSGDDHWQTHFERSASTFIRIQQRDWDTPSCTEWIEEIERALKGFDLSTVVLIGHSLGCATIANWANRFGHQIKGALLVAPSDVEAPKYDFKTAGFEKMPLNALPFKTIVVNSSNDEWVSVERAKYFADAWKSEWIDIGNGGHINTASGFGEWPEGLEILKSLDV